jgi:hypothetical protein
MSRYNLDIVGETDEALNRLSQNTTSKAEAIRRAISIAAWVEQTQREGKKILVEDQNGSIREIHWRQ